MTEPSLLDATHTSRAREFISNVWPLYVHELQACGERFYTLDASGRYQPDVVPLWLARVTPNSHLREARAATDPSHPFARAHLLLMQDEPVGFVCVARQPFRYMPEDVDRYLAELFVVPAARGTGVALAGVRATLQLAPSASRWGLRCLKGNRAALRFWERALSGLGVRELEQHDAADVVSFRFRSP